jgi:hypothetical protein
MGWPFDQNQCLRVIVTTVFLSENTGRWATLAGPLTAKLLWTPTTYRLGHIMFANWPAFGSV